MGYKFKCQSCGAEIFTPDKNINDTVQCPHCENYNIVPPNAFEYSEAPSGVQTTTDEVRGYGRKTVGDIFAEAFKIYGRNFIPIIGIMALVGIPLAIISGILIEPYNIMAGKMGSDPTNLPSTEMMLSSTMLFFISILISTIGGSYMAGALAFAVGDRYRGKPMRVLHSYGMAFKRIFQLIGVQLLITLVVSIISMTVIGSPFALFLAVVWIFGYVIVIFEMKGPVDALRRSYHLVKGEWWRTLGIMLAFGLTLGIVYLILFFIPYIGQAIATIFISPIGMIALIVLYLDRRRCRENYTMQDLENEMAVLESAE